MGVSYLTFAVDVSLRNASVSVARARLLVVCRGVKVARWEGERLCRRFLLNVCSQCVSPKCISKCDSDTTALCLHNHFFLSNIGGVGDTEEVKSIPNYCCT